MLRSYIREFGVVPGFLVVFYTAIGHITEKRLLYGVKLKKAGENRFFLRTHSSDNNIARTIFGETGEYDFLKQDKYLNIVLNAEMIVDAGANIGCFSRYILNLNPITKLIAVEPDEMNYKVLEKNLSYFENAIGVLGGVWNKKCHLSIKPRDTGDLGFVVSEVDKEGSNLRGYGIYDLMSGYKFSKIDILKVDIEGSELEVFDDSSEGWVEGVKMIIIELHDRIKPGCCEQVMTRLIGHGFSYEKYGEDYIFVR